MYRNPRRSVLWLKLIAAVVILLMVATIVRGDRAPIPQLWGGVVVSSILWLTWCKLTPSRPGPDVLYMHVGYFASALVVTVGGLLFVATGGDGRNSLRLLGVLVAAVGVVMIVAAIHDFRLWRDEVRRQGWRLLSRAMVHATSDCDAWHGQATQANGKTAIED